jgi:gentisate 1,2-dioxygenase
MHKHQGGLVIFVLEGEGYTLLNGQRVDWEKGDLLLLPIIPGGIAHQHFNRMPGSSCKWLAITYGPFSYIMGSMFEQKELSPDWVKVRATGS